MTSAYYAQAKFAPPRTNMHRPELRDITIPAIRPPHRRLHPSNLARHSPPLSDPGKSSVYQAVSVWSLTPRGLFRRAPKP
jgi:hypothetical protein